jgi:predicted RecB family endonuclease
MMRKFRIIVEVEDNECSDSKTESIEEIKEIYQKEVFASTGYDITFHVKEVTEIK